MSKADELQQRITNEVIAAIEAGAGEWDMPWKKLAASGVPRSVSTGKPYRGINWWQLGMTQLDKGYRSHWWATFKQWQELLPEDAHVLKDDQKSTEVLLWKPNKRKVRNPDGSVEEKDSLYATTFRVFNADQILDPPAKYLQPPPQLTEHERIEACETYFAAISLDVRVGGDRAYYAPVQDYIAVPTLPQFQSPEHYYSTLAHEHVHATSHPSRLDRKLGRRFGDEAYAMEELVAELGAAFFSAQMGIDQATRQDHSSYLAHWLKVLKADPKALVTTASKASAAVEWLDTAAAVQPTEQEMQPA